MKKPRMIESEEVWEYIHSLTLIQESENES